MSGFECASIFVGHSGLVNKAIGTFHEWAKFCCFNIVNCEMVHIHAGLTVLLVWLPIILVYILAATELDIIFLEKLVQLLVFRDFF